MNTMLNIVALLATLSLELVAGSEIGVKLFGGKDAKKTENRFTVWIQKAGDPLYSCGGSLIEVDWVLTAANCFDPAEHLISYKIIVGDYNRKREDGQVVIQPDTYILHPDYNSSTLANNVAVAHLSESVNVSVDNIELVPRLSTAPLDAVIPRKDRCTFSSFGPDQTGVPNKRIQTLVVKVQNDSSCANITNYNDDSDLCYTGDPGGPCNGDEGSPIVCLIGTDWTLVGVHSVGSCSTGSHSASQVSFHKKWIRRTIVTSVPISCGTPPMILNGTFETNGTNIENDEAVLACNSGYGSDSAVVSDNTITCESSGNWSSVSVSCVKSCAGLPSISNGTFAINGRNIVNDTATLNCDSGFSTSSSVEADITISCQSNGSWTSIDATCIRSCGALPNVANGTFSTNGTNTVNDTAILECDSGFVPSSENIADATVTCQSGGAWSETAVTCLRSCDSIPDAVNGSYVVSGRSVANATAVLNCDNGFVRSESNDTDATITCQTDGSWTSSAASCIRSCAVPVNETNGTFVSNGSNVVNDTAVLVCDSGFTISSDYEDDATITCRQTGVWDTATATCLKSCDALPAVTNGSYVLSGRNVVNDTANLGCDSGFVYSSSNEATLTCQSNGSWSSSDVFCVRSCGTLPVAQNGTFDSNGTNIVNDTATLNCDEGFILSSENQADGMIICQDDGVWSSTGAACLKSCDTLPSTTNGSYVLDGRNIVNSTAVLTCDNGFLPSSSSVAEYTLVCESSGSWTSSDVGCVRTCGEPPEPDNGSFSTNGTNIVNDTATLECDSLFVLSTEVESAITIMCQNDGTWGSAGATCIRTCGEPPKPGNGSFSTNGTNLVNDTATLECDSGFVLSTEEESAISIVCQNDGTWSSAGVTCIRSCGNLPAAVNGSYVSNGTNVVNDTAILVCDNGFLRSTEIDIDATIVCNSNGSWSMTDTACMKSCGVPVNEANGTFVSSGTNVVNDTVVLVCDSGFTISSDLEDDATITCRQTGVWDTATATCLKNCDALPAVTNGSYVLSGRNVVNDTANLGCDSGFVYSLSNEATIKCQSDGSWSSSDVFCVRSCGTLPVAQNGTFDSNGTNIVNDTATLNCDEGFILASENPADGMIVCQDDGVWSSADAVCLRSCGTLPSTTNGSYVLDGRNIVNSTAVLTCNSGFLPSSSSVLDYTLVCESSGSWTSPDTVCVRTCGEPLEPDNGSFSTKGTNIVNDTATLECDSSFVLSTEEESAVYIMCQNDGTWSSAGATCIRTCGEPPKPDNGSFSTNGTNTVNDTATLECDSGFVLSTEEESAISIVCQNDGTWSSAGATCIRSCGNLPEAMNGSYASNGTNVVNDTAILFCDNGFLRSTEIDIDATIVCNNDGNWSMTDAACIKICEPLPGVNNGTFASNGTGIVDDTATLDCDVGFQRSTLADASIVCQLDGTWSSTNATCIRSCGTLPFVQNGAFDTNGTNVLDDTAILVCDVGFARSSDVEAEYTITCKASGAWSSSDVTCLRECGLPPSVSGGSYLSNGSNVEGDTATLTCDVGYVSSSSDVTEIVCQNNGTWATSDVTCLRGCGAPPSIVNGTYVSSDSGLVNDTATLTCDGGYRISSAALDDIAITCQADGFWSSNDVTCEKECGSAGTSFMLAFFENVYKQGKPYIYLMTNEPTEVTVNVPFYPDQVTFVLQRYARIYLNNRITGSGDDDLSNKGVAITSLKPITMYAHHYRGRRGPSAEGTLILPVECASTDYLVVSHDDSVVDSSKSQVMIVGLTDNTQVSIDLPSGTTKTITLDRFGSYQYREQDLNGAIIRADSAVVTLAGHTCANVPTGDTTFCDYIMEQMPPMSSLKKAYILSYMKPRPNFSVRIVAAYNDTEVFIRDTNGAVIQQISLGKAESFMASFYNEDTISIISNKGVLVAQYGHGMSSDSYNFGDPSMVVVPGLGQFERDYHVHAPKEFYRYNYVSIVISDAFDISGLRLNGNELKTDNSVSIHVPGYGDFKVLNVRAFNSLNSLTHTDSEATYGALLYGYNYRVGYSWMAGRVV